MTTSIINDIATPLEYSEVAYWSKLYGSHSPLPCYASVIAGAFSGAVPKLDILALNRVIGLGVECPVKADDIDSIIHFYKAVGTKRFFVQLSPLAQQKNLSVLLEEKGFRHYNNWVKLLRTSKPLLARSNSQLEVVHIDTAAQANVYGQIICTSFGWKEDQLAHWLAASVGKPGYRHYLVMSGDKAIAAGALHIMNHYASMAFAGTLPAYRGLGAQSLLLETRISEAMALECDYFISETAEEKPDKPVSSFRNMRRYGFDIAYLRQNWIFEF